MQAIWEQYQAVRQFSAQLCAVLSPEDCTIQSMPDASPAKWHLAHTTWFFETFVLRETSGYQAFHPDFEHLFNSYYNAIGEQYARSQRGVISRPGLEETLAYRRHVDAAMGRLLEEYSDAAAQAASRIELGLQHEQQHQELILTDIKHALWCNPLQPWYRSGRVVEPVARQPVSWIDCDPGLCSLGDEESGFAFDNERPRHRQWVEPFALADRTVTCGEWLAFIEDGGYSRPELWMSLGWSEVQQQAWQAPLYWAQGDDGWTLFTLAGCRPVASEEPVCHISWFEADAFARWSGARLPTEAEWETAAVSLAAERTAGDALADLLLADDRALHPPAVASGGERLQQMIGGVWEWTVSSYGPYPGFIPAVGALGEYNGKFMCNQYVLRGGSCATPSSHIRPTYRNFFPPGARWQFSGVRLAR
ncbi:ergothioneine biosynthesis protein EgtB [Lignipirellula cremea]|uniref:Iron(II)-dependent oxidoreductase EgtB n=1 Tax=Lignipirellula cremea TaxID=2528010 RepID=A0A518DZ06_9BACT|nr:ergothioneine biosynthesis protein EgtB [Lignipirellula cremea]QDU97078.1 Iron(II)-dependent oxidoreductase EgtB [Lignipirellula cremea]